MYICPTCNSETTQPIYKNNRPFCPGGHRVFNESVLRALMNGLVWGIVLLLVVTMAQDWVLVIPFAAAGVSLYKAWRLSQRGGLPRRLSRTFLSFSIGILLPMGLLIYPGSKQISANLGVVRHRLPN